MRHLRERAIKAISQNQLRQECQHHFRATVNALNSPWMPAVGRNMMKYAGNTASTRRCGIPKWQPSGRNEERLDPFGWAAGMLFCAHSSAFGLRPSTAIRPGPNLQLKLPALQSGSLPRRKFHLRTTEASAQRSEVPKQEKLGFLNQLKTPISPKHLEP